jgi:hypothetical protein
MPRPGVGGCFCRKTEAKSRRPSCRSVPEPGLGGAARESIFPRRGRQRRKAARACFEHQNLPATGVIEAGSRAAGKCERRYDCQLSYIVRICENSQKSVANYSYIVRKSTSAPVGNVWLSSAAHRIVAGQRQDRLSRSAILLVERHESSWSQPDCSRQVCIRDRTLDLRHHTRRLS